MIVTAIRIACRGGCSSIRAIDYLQMLNYYLWLIYFLAFKASKVAVPARFLLT